MGAEASAWSVETGGDLFGRWRDVPVVFLATKAGPAAQRDHAHFRLDVDYLRELSEVLASPWGLRYFGDWHSHHRLGLSSPSGGDRGRIVGLARRNQFPAMCEAIVTLEEDRGAPTVRIHPWLYDLADRAERPSPMDVKVLPGISPVREALLASGALPEQDLSAWEDVSLSRIRLESDTNAPTLEPEHETDGATTDSVLLYLAGALESASGSAVEQHVTEFGWVVAAHLDGPNYVAIALDSAWPLAVLAVHRLDRDTGGTEPLDAPTGLSALDVPRLLELYHAIERNDGSDYVDI